MQMNRVLLPITTRVNGIPSTPIVSFAVIAWRAQAETAHTGLMVTDSDGYFYILEWGDLTATNNMSFDVVDRTMTRTLSSGGTTARAGRSSRSKGTQGHPNGNWQAFTIEEGLVENVALRDIFNHAATWADVLAAPKSYPHNCFGYVDSARVSVLGQTTVLVTKERIFDIPRGMVAN